MKDEIYVLSKPELVSEIDFETERILNLSSYIDLLAKKGIYSKNNKKAFISYCEEIIRRVENLEYISETETPETETPETTKFRHFKGKIYTVICYAVPTDGLKLPYTLVIYKDEEGRIWARSWDEFFGYVKTDAGSVRRFMPI